MSESVDKVGTVRAAPASDKIVAGGVGVSVVACGDVVEIGGVVRAQPDDVEGGVDEAEGGGRTVQKILLVR